MLELFKNSLSVFLLIPLVLLIGAWLSLRFEWVQCTHVIKAWQFFTSDRNRATKASSSFSAVAAVLGGNLGTGNISGIAVALTMGGPGALFWMWVMAGLGAILKFVGCTLGVLYRRQASNGDFLGGPMYYLAQGLKRPTLAKVYCLLAIGAALSVGNLVQMNSLTLPLTQLGVPPLVSGLGMSMLVGAVILGGLQRFSTIAALVVPFMAIGYIGTCIVILTMHANELLPALQHIIQAAFSASSLAGGITGFAVLTAMQVGFDRGLFATDVGVGIDSIIHATVESDRPLTQHALTQGLISTLSPFIVMLVCTLTGLVLMVTKSWLIPGLESTNLCLAAFQTGLGVNWAGHIITVTLFFFAYTTILTWSFCADKAVQYLFSTQFVKPFQWLFIATLPLGAMLHVQAIWSIADIFMNLMLLINLVGIVGLYPEVMTLFRHPERFVATLSLRSPTL